MEKSGDRCIFKKKLEDDWAKLFFYGHIQCRLVVIFYYQLSLSVTAQFFLLLPGRHSLCVTVLWGAKQHHSV